MIGKLLALILLSILLVSLAIAAVEVLGWLLGGSAVVAGLGYAAWRISQRERQPPTPPAKGEE